MEQEPKLDPSTITDVETAKLALRWAVEKIHGLQEEVGRLREDNRNKTAISRSLTEQVEQKTEVLKKWQGTIKTWEENWKTQTAMEADLKAKLREQILNEESTNWRAARVQLEKEIFALKNELGAKEAEIGRVKLAMIDEHRKSAEIKEEEFNTLLSKHQDNLTVREVALRDKYDRLEHEFLENQRLRAEQEELSLRARYEAKAQELSKLHEQKEAQLETFRKQVEDERFEKLEALKAQAEKDREARRQEFEETSGAKAAERAAAAEARIQEARAATETRLAALEKDYDARIARAEEEKKAELEAFKAAGQRELETLRARMKEATEKREQEYVNLRLEMEGQLVELVKKREEEIRARYERSLEEARAQWGRAVDESRALHDQEAVKAAATMEADFKKREESLRDQLKKEFNDFREKTETEARAREEALRAAMLEEQSAWAVRQQKASDDTRHALEASHAERLESLKAGLEEAYIMKEKALETRVASVQRRVRAEWLAREDEWCLEKEADLHEEKEKLKAEFEAHRSLLHNKLSQFEDELKLKFAQKENEAEAARRAALSPNYARKGTTALTLPPPRLPHPPHTHTHRFFIPFPFSHF